jgi:hypothetical protein
MKYIKLFESFITEVAGYPLVPASSAVKGWIDDGDGTFIVKCDLGKIYVATADTQNAGNISIFLTAADPETQKQLVAVGCKESSPTGGYTITGKDGTNFTFNKMYILTLTDVKAGDPILVSVWNILNKKPANASTTATTTVVPMDFTGLKASTSVDPKVKTLQTALINSGNKLVAAALAPNGANGIYDVATATAIGMLIADPNVKATDIKAVQEITAEINKILVDKLKVTQDAGKAYANSFFGTANVENPDGTITKVNIGDVIDKSKKP